MSSPPSSAERIPAIWAKSRSAEGPEFQERPRGRPVPLSASIAAACRASSATWSAAYALAAGQSVLLVREEHDAHGAARRPRQRGDLARGLEDDAAARAVVDGAAAEVPRIQVRTEHDDFAGRLASRHLADHVRRFGVRPRSAGEREADAHGAVAGEQVRDEVGVGRRKGPPPESSARPWRTRALRCGEADCRRCRSTAPARRSLPASRRGTDRPSDTRRFARSPSRPWCGRSGRRRTRCVRGRRPRRVSSSSNVVMRTTSASTPSGGVATMPPRAVSASFCETGAVISPDLGRARPDRDDDSLRVDVGEAERRHHLDGHGHRPRDRPAIRPGAVRRDRSARGPTPTPASRRRCGRAGGSRRARSPRRAGPLRAPGRERPPGSPGRRRQRREPRASTSTTSPRWISGIVSGGPASRTGGKSNRIPLLMATRTPEADLSEELLSEFGGNASYVADLLRPLPRESFGGGRRVAALLPGTVRGAGGRDRACRPPRRPSPCVPRSGSRRRSAPRSRASGCRSAAARSGSPRTWRRASASRRRRRSARSPSSLADENRRLINEHRAAAEQSKISFTHSVAWAILRASNAFPGMNDAFDGSSGEPARACAATRSASASRWTSRRRTARARFSCRTSRAPRRMTFAEFVARGRRRRHARPHRASSSCRTSRARPSR